MCAFQISDRVDQDNPNRGMTQTDIIDSLPRHLRPFVALQDYRAYTPRDQAVWRFLLHQLRDNLSRTAHPVYMEGLRRTGISLERIPGIEAMNECLGQFGWRAVVVNGFIPPIVFMELQALKVLAIATEIRSMPHMLYTPAPDIVHESAGHAPFIVDEDYSEFLQRFGELGMRAIATRDDINLYEAVRHLSIVKESASAGAAQVTAAEERLQRAMAAIQEPSEAALLARLQWWVIEYGLVGSLQDYRIFGAGLLSSLGESVNCLDDRRVPKRPLTVNAVATPYDITREQPQLFVARNCRHLMQVLDEFGRRMAVTRGGPEAMALARKAATVNTAVLSSGLQVSGKIVRVHEDAVGNVIYFNTEGATQLAYDGEQLPGHGIDYHAQGFGSPVGRLQGMTRCLADYTVDELKEQGIASGAEVALEFVSGICVTGTLRKILRREQKNILLTLEPCRVTNLDGEVLFDPDWGTYDMGVGDDIRSVFGGSADPLHYPLFAPPMEPVRPQREEDATARLLLEAYERVRSLRESGAAAGQVHDFVTQVRHLPRGEWLLYFELLELASLRGVEDPALDWFRQRLQQMGADEVDVEQRTLVRYALQRLQQMTLEKRSARG